MLKVNLNEKIESTLKLNNTKLILLALLPSIFLMFFIFGWGTITNIIFSIIFLNLTNLLISILNKNKFKIKENKLTYVSIFILSLSLPPYLEWWILLIGLLFAVLISSKVFIFFSALIALIPRCFLMQFYLFFSKRNVNMASTIFIIITTKSWICRNNNLQN